MSTNTYTKGQKKQLSQYFISTEFDCHRNVGGATGSRHTKGDAADIIVKGHTPREVAQYAIVDRISKGATFTLLETQNGWGHIEKGWVSMEYVS